MRRNKLPPDKRLDWRDPNIPVLRYGRMRDNEPWRLMNVDSATISAHSQRSLNNPNYPNWRDDPTYDMRIDRGKEIKRRTSTRP